MKELDDLAVEYSCDYCKAGPGQWCETKSGARAEWLHVARSYPVNEAYHLGWQGEEEEMRARIKSLPEDALLAWRQRLLDGGRW